MPLLNSCIARWSSQEIYTSLDQFKVLFKDFAEELKQFWRTKKPRRAGEFFSIRLVWVYRIIKPASFPPWLWAKVGAEVCTYVSSPRIPL